MRRALLTVGLLAVAGVLVWIRCGGGSSPPVPAPPPATVVPTSGLVVLVMLENQRYEKVIGSPAMPYFNSLADRYALATGYFANTHPSIGNYFMLTTGRIITNDSNFTGIVTEDNLVRRMVTAGVSWRAYAQGLPSVGHVGGDAYPYVKRHNPFAYFSDVVNSAEQRNHLVPLDRFAQDLSAGMLPRYLYLLPDQRHNGHDCPPGLAGCTRNDKLAAVDRWLQDTLEPLLAQPAFQQDGLLIVNWDESEDGDDAHGGGHIAVILAGPRVRPGYRSPYFYQHENGLRLMLEALGIRSFPGASATANNMSDLFAQE